MSAGPDTSVGASRVWLTLDFCLGPEPRVPFDWQPWPDFQAPTAFDVVCLARSLEYTPPQSDLLFEAIRERFVDERALSDS